MFWIWNPLDQIIIFLYFGVFFLFYLEINIVEK